MALFARTSRHRNLLLASVLVFFSMLVPNVHPAHAQDAVIWQQSMNPSTFADWGPSQKSHVVQPAVNAEVADDFDLQGTITSMDVTGYNSTNTCPNCGRSFPGFSGVAVRFYAYGTDGVPAALQANYFVPAGDAKLTYDPAYPSSFTIALSPAFQATGKHFVSVQPQMEPHTPSTPSDNAFWYWRSADDGTPRGQTLFFRDNAAGQTTWSHTFPTGTANSDAAFTLYGTRVLLAPTLTALSTDTLAQAGRLILTGTNFGAQQGSGVVLIGGIAAPVSRWSDTAITAYVPDATPLGNDQVQVRTSGGTSGAQVLTVIARQRVGQVRWRFQADGLYIMSRPAVGADGTVYAEDVNGHLYALSPAGGVKWIFDGGGGNNIQPVSVGADGTIYFSMLASVFAINPDGSQKWHFQDPSGLVFAGPNVGPDGSIYAVTDYAGAGTLGAFALSPAGQLLWHRSGYTTGRGALYGRELVFGAPGQLYFTSNQLQGQAGLQALHLNGTPRFAQPAAGLQPAVGPQGTVYVLTVNTPNTQAELGAFTPQGKLVRRFFSTGTRNLTTPDIGSDGTIYIGRNYTSFVATGPTGGIKWSFTNGLNYNGPIASPANTLVVAGAYDNANQGYVQAVTTAGKLAWTLSLPAENGGFVRPVSRPRFTADGATVYVGMDVNDGAADPYSYLYAIDTSTGPAAPAQP